MHIRPNELKIFFAVSIFASVGIRSGRVFLIPSAVVSLVGIFNAVRAEIFSDKIWLIAGVIVYLTVSIIEISCLITVKEDAED